MARLREGKNPSPVEPAAKKRGSAEDSEAANGGPLPVQRVIEFPNHRVLCGDGTRDEDLARVLEGNCAIWCFRICLTT